MPVDTQVRLADGDHVVQFYEHDDELVGVVAGYLGVAVRDGDAVIVIASPSHRAAFEAAMFDAGADVAAARSEHRLVMLDAATVLAAFMRPDGRPDPSTFGAVVGGVLRLTAERGRPLRAYGEMVALLWDDGKAAGAIELERLWNDLGEQLPFSLFCAYPSHMVNDPAAGDALRQVCRLHSEVVATATDAVEVTRRLDASPQAPRQARLFVAETLRGWGRGDLVDDAVLVVTELTTNAVVHGKSDVTIGLSRRGGGIRLAVGDASSLPPVPGGLDGVSLGGRGLRLVQAIADRWGHRQVTSGAGAGGGGKVVWVELGLGTASSLA